MKKEQTKSLVKKTENDEFKIFKKNVAYYLRVKKKPSYTGDIGFDHYVFSKVLDPSSSLDISYQAAIKIARHLKVPLWKLQKPRVKK